MSAFILGINDGELIKLLRCEFFLAGALIAFAVVQAHASDPERCIVSATDSIRLERHPTSVHGLDLQVEIAYEGFLKIGNATVPSPTGDITVSAGPYDPVNELLYVWGYFKNGWINVRTGENRVIRPFLYSPVHDIEDVTYIQRSEALSVQFYSGHTSPHWLTGHQSYRVYILSGSEMNRAQELEDKQLRYIGDDPHAALAVFASEGVAPFGNPNALVWFDGTKIVPSPANTESPTRFCEPS